MIPDFSLIVSGADITGLVRRRLIGLTVTDEAGIKSDALDVTLDDRDARIAVPSPGAVIAVSLGYKEVGLTPMGQYTADDVTLSGPPASLGFRGASADMGGSLKSMKTRNFDDMTLGGLARTIAGEHSLKAAVSETLRSIAYDHIAQVDESDMHLLTRLAKDHDAIATVKAGALLLAERGLGRSIGGAALPVIAVDQGEVTDYRVTLAERGKYRSVVASWHDETTGKTEAVTAGDGEPTYRLRHVRPTRERARQAAHAKLKSLTRGKAQLSLTLPGNPTIAAEARIRLSGIRSGVDGLWSITTVTHTLDNGGFKTQIKAETPSG